MRAPGDQQQGELITYHGNPIIPLGIEHPIAVTPSFSTPFQGFPNFSKEIPRKFQTFPRISKLFPWPFRGKSRGCRSVEPESRLLQFLPRLGRDERPGDTPPNAPAIQYSANSDYRKEIVATIFRKRPRGERGDASAKAKADRRAAGARATSTTRSVTQRDGAAPVEKVWRRLRAAKFGNSHPAPVSLDGTLRDTAVIRKCN
jgi:hypothetical protein